MTTSHKFKFEVQKVRVSLYLPSGKQTWPWKIAMYSWFSRKSLWFFIAMLVITRGYIPQIPLNHHIPMVFLWFVHCQRLISSVSSNRSRVSSGYVNGMWPTPRRRAHLRRRTASGGPGSQSPERPLGRPDGHRSCGARGAPRFGGESHGVSMMDWGKVPLWCVVYGEKQPLWVDIIEVGYGYGRFWYALSLSLSM